MSSGIQLEQVADGKLLPPNLLTNPGFEIWQRGNGPFVSTSVGTSIFTADEFAAFCGFAGNSISVSRNSADKKFGNYCAEVTLTGLGGGEYSYIQQGVENAKQLEGLDITLTIWVKASSANTVRLALYDWNGSVATGGFSDWHSGSGEWEPITMTHTVNTGLVPTTTTAHLFPLYFSVLGYADTTFYVDGATLVLGNFPQGMPFIPLNPAEDMQRCQRFYCKSTNSADGLVHYTYAVSGDSSTGALTFPVTMQAVPTVTVTNEVSYRYPASYASLVAGVGGFREGHIASATGTGYWRSQYTAEVT